MTRRQLRPEGGRVPMRAGGRPPTTPPARWRGGLCEWPAVRLLPGAPRTPLQATGWADCRGAAQDGRPPSPRGAAGQPLARGQSRARASAPIGAGSLDRPGATVRPAAAVSCSVRSCSGARARKWFCRRDADSTRPRAASCAPRRRLAPGRVGSDDRQKRHTRP